MIEGKELSKWLGSARNLALLPLLLQKQILIGREVQEAFEVESGKQVMDLVDKVITDRDEAWLDYYQREVKLAELDKDQVARHESAEPAMVKAALSEARYAAAMWDDLARHDHIAIYPVGGWWKSHLGQQRHSDTTRYSRAISITADGHDVDLYSEIKAEVDAANLEAEIET